MRYRVVQPQWISRHCFVCGVDNPLGLKARFFDLENGDTAGIYTPAEVHQGYPGRQHGGITAAILDEVMGRAISLKQPEVWGVTVELSLRYLKPAPVATRLIAVGRVTRDSRRLFETVGELYLPGGILAATATGRYIKMRFDQVAQDVPEDELVPPPSDSPEVVEY
jgi:acyl-coenzyme A thioesterase PaaI-like protein